MKITTNLRITGLQTQKATLEFQKKTGNYQIHCKQDLVVYCEEFYLLVYSAEESVNVNQRFGGDMYLRNFD
jgi:hypothetical protein